MNIIELQDNLKDLPDSALMQEMQMPTGNMPQFLVLSELKRRKRMRDEYQRQQAADMPTVAEEVMTAAGAPQQGLTAIARNMAPNSSIAQNTSADMAVQREPTRMPQKMAEGGFLNYLQSVLSGGKPDRTIDDEIDSRVSADLDDFLATDSMGNIPSNLVPSSIVAAPDFDATDIDDILDAEENRLDQQEIAANIRNQNLPSLSQIDSTIDRDSFGFDGNEVSFDDLLYQAQDGQRYPPIIEREFSNQIDFNTAQVPENIQKELADALGFAVDADERNEAMARLEEIDTPPPSVLAGQSNKDSSSMLSSIIPSFNLPEVDLNIFRKGEQALAAIDQKLASGELSEADARALQIQRTALNTALSTGQAIDNTVADALALVNRVVGGPALDLAAGVTSVFSPETGGAMFEFADDFDAETDRLAEEGFIPDNRNLDDDIAPLADEDRSGDPIQSRSPTVLEQTTGTPLEIPSEEKGGVESLLPTLLGDDDSGTTGNVGSGAPSGGDAYTKLESRIAKMLDDREKSAESDKFLALAQAGLALMASDSPTLGGAIGEAGLVGISQLREARNQYDKDILGLLSTQADIDAARSEAALEKRRLDLEEEELNRTGMKPGDLLDYLAALNKQQTTLTKQLSENLIEDSDDVRNRIILNELEIERVKRQLGYGSSTKDLAD